MIQNILIHKAGSVGGLPVESKSISISKEMPDFQSLKDTEHIFDSDAEAIVKALCESLPQGTVDRVLAKLMAKKASSFVGTLE